MAPGPLAWIATAVLCAGCGGEVASDSTVRINLLSSGTRVSVDAWIFNVVGGVSIDRRVDVPASGSVRAFEGSLKHGDYDINIHPASDDHSGCFGEDDFSVVQGRPLTVTVALHCPQQVLKPMAPQGDPPVRVYECPYSYDLTAEPLRAPVGGTIHLGTRLSEPDALVYWSTDSSGILSDPNAATPDYTCTEAGNHAISVNVLKLGTACSQILSTTVVCDPSPGDRDD